MSSIKTVDPLSFRALDSILGPCGMSFERVAIIRGDANNLERPGDAEELAGILTEHEFVTDVQGNDIFVRGMVSDIALHSYARNYRFLNLDTCLANLRKVKMAGKYVDIFGILGYTTTLDPEYDSVLVAIDIFQYLLNEHNACSGSDQQIEANLVSEYQKDDVIPSGLTVRWKSEIDANICQEMWLEGWPEVELDWSVTV